MYQIVHKKNKLIVTTFGLMERCNICNTDVQDVDAHVKSSEHLENLKKVKTMFNSKVYQNDRIGIE